MSLQTGLQVVGLLAIGYLLFVGLLAMGPIGWLVFVPMLVIGIAQAHRKRVRRRGSERGEPNYCPNCGSAVELDGFGEPADTDGPDEGPDSDWAVNYCPDCGAPLEFATDDRDDSSDPSRSGSTNCPDCGAPNDPSRASCEYCGLEL